MYSDIGITKQWLYYWEINRYSTLPRQAVCSVIVKAKKLFNLTDKECEKLAASAGISLTEGDISFYDFVRNCYKGSLRKLCYMVTIDERTFRYYKCQTPPKNVVISICAVLGYDKYHTDMLLHKLGYCLSDSILTDSVVAFYLRENSQEKGLRRLNMINTALYEMGVSPLINANKK